jgi:hypothetical protein
VLKQTPWLAALMLLPSCMPHGPSSGTVPPPSDTVFSMQWLTSKTGYVFRTNYFTAGQVTDPAWEAKRLSKLKKVLICETGQHVARRDVRWFPATPESGQRCAAVIYTIVCDVPTHATIDSLEQDRRDEVFGELDSPPEKDCGEKDWTKFADRPPNDIARYRAGVSLLVDRPVCDLDTPTLNGEIHVLPKTRIGVTTLIDTAYADRAGVPEWWEQANLSDAPNRVLGSALRNAGKVGAIFPPDGKVSPDHENILVTQAIGLNKSGHLYCVQLTVIQAGKKWRRTIEHTGPEGYEGIGIFPNGVTPHKPSATDIDDLGELWRMLSTSAGVVSK